MPSIAPISSLDAPRRWHRTHWARPLLALVAISGLWAICGGRQTNGDEQREPSASVAASLALSRQGTQADPASIRWVDPPHESRRFPYGTHRFVAVGHRVDEPNDVWLGAARLSPEGRWLSLNSLYNLSDTSAADEANLRVSRGRIAWTINNDDEVVAVQVVDVKGQPLPNDGALTWLERWQTRLTFLQETGQLSGLCRRVYRLDRPRQEVELAWTSAGLEVRSGPIAGVLRCDGATIDQGITAEPSELGSPGDLITWAVDRVRAIPWFGTDRMQWVKAVSFDLLDRFESVKRRVIPIDGSERLKNEIGNSSSMGSNRASDPESGWPPPPMQPILTPPLQNEGVFRPLDDDPFAVPPWGGPSPFAFSFLRPDPSRPESQLFVVLWDPRLVELHTMTGTREPKTATGETGSGTVPRNDDTISRFAGAFNGGFQATHGEFGMMAQRVVYLPPKPYAATVAEFADGSLGMGTWPDDEAIPETLVGFRQNLTPLLSDGIVNPYRRTWWGGVPPGWHDATRTVRTGLCLTGDHFVAYFYGASINADHLVAAMQSARCNYGVHLDMNPGHTGFEFYRVARAGMLPPVQRKLDTTWETRGPVAGATGWEFMGRRLLRSMHLMHFPRYVRTDSRDFFYLTHRSILPPSTPLGRAATGQVIDLAWRIREHEQRGFPPAVATLNLHPDPARPEMEVTITALDGKWLTACSSDCDDATSVARIGRSTPRQGTGVYLHARRFVATSSPPPDAVPIASGTDETQASRPVAALGIARGDWLMYAEVTRAGDRSRDAVVLKRILTNLGASPRLYLDQPLDVSIGGAARGGRRAGELVFLRNSTPMAGRMFRDTTVVEPSTWQPLQAKRVRYVRRANRVEPSSVDASETQDITKSESDPEAR